MIGNIRDVYIFRELKGYGTFFDELCLIMTGFDRGKRLGGITAELWDGDIGWN